MKFHFKPDIKIVFIVELWTYFAFSMMQNIWQSTPLDCSFLYLLFFGKLNKTSANWNTCNQNASTALELQRGAGVDNSGACSPKFSQSALASPEVPIPLLFLSQKLSSIELNSTESGWDCSRVGKRANSVRRTTLERVQFALMNVSACSYWI